MDRFLSSSRYSSQNSCGTVTTPESSLACTPEARRRYPGLQQHSNSLPNTVGRGNKTTPSIPISSTSMRRTASETQMSQEEAEAEYKDYLFYSRVVQGISSKQEQYQDGYLKYENQISLNNIVRTRNEAMYDMGLNDGGYDNNIITGYDAHGRPVLYNPFPVDPAEHDALEAGIFDLDL